MIGPVTSTSSSSGGVWNESTSGLSESNGHGGLQPTRPGRSRWCIGPVGTVEITCGNTAAARSPNGGISSNTGPPSSGLGSALKDAMFPPNDGTGFSGSNV